MTTEQLPPADAGPFERRVMQRFCCDERKHMRYRSTVERVGEKLGPIDWQHPKLQGPGAVDGDRLQRAVQALRDIEAAITTGGSAQATSHGGDCWMFCMQDVLDVGMYDGWPHWAPYPAVCLEGPLGAEWKSFDMLNHHIARSAAEVARGLAASA